MSGIHLYESKHQESYEVKIHHHSNVQILYAIEGHGTVLLEGQQYDFEQDNAAFIVPYSEHAVSSDSNLTLLVLAFDEFAGSRDVHPDWKPYLFTSSELLKLNAFQASEMRLLLRKLLFEQKQSDPLSGWAMHNLLQDIYLLMVRARETKPVQDANGLRAERIRNYIDLHYYESITSEELSSKLGISIRQMNKIFKKEYQMTPMQYLTEVRMGLAQKLLAESDKDIVSICFEVGYESLPTFYRTFKLVLNMSPNKYRQQHQAVDQPYSG
ncbi:AraC family transcriptional regulator [Paenibacillus sp. NPDC056579]|uniref:helix-turn-helix transcriptional regulator n=1 Tax=unclassified Paenibacillus TaxID=185978 RepID=UPI001EF906F0|nr:AraC family transcriptional regulator [Paenibacillus sp. H1-7]ULL15413.1 AraC family transcriptional regulator [Paenibacillus sp. H1-7]